MNRLLLLLTFSVLLLSCGNSKTDVTEKKDYYPIAGYIRTQVAHLDSMPLGILHYRTENNITDSLVIDKPDFNANIAGAFIESDISSTDKMQGYKETPFLDAGTGTMTLVYEAESQQLPVRKVDVLLSAANSDIHTIYIERITEGADSLVMQKMLWTHDKNCQIITIVNKPGLPEKVTIDQYVWNK